MKSEDAMEQLLFKATMGLIGGLVIGGVYFAGKWLIAVFFSNPAAENREDKL